MIKLETGDVENFARDNLQGQIDCRARIYIAALDAFIGAGLSKDDAKIAVEAIAKKVIPNVSITY